jgi:hypothetical protein
MQNAAQALRFWQHKVLALHEQCIQTCLLLCNIFAVAAQVRLTGAHGEGACAAHAVRSQFGGLHRQADAHSVWRAEAASCHSWRTGAVPKGDVLPPMSLHDYDIISVYSGHCLQSSLKH